MTPVTLEKFEVIFHLLCGYYFLLAIIEKFHYYFGFDHVIHKYKKRYDEAKNKNYIVLIGELLDKQERELRDELAENTRRMDLSSGSIDNILRPSRVKIKEFKKKKRQILSLKGDLTKGDTWGDDIIRLHYAEDK